MQDVKKTGDNEETGDITKTEDDGDMLTEDKEDPLISPDFLCELCPLSSVPCCTISPLLY